MTRRIASIAASIAACLFLSSVGLAQQPSHEEETFRHTGTQKPTSSPVMTPVTTHNASTPTYPNFNESPCDPLAGDCTCYTEPNPDGGGWLYCPPPPPTPSPSISCMATLYTRPVQGTEWPAGAYHTFWYSFVVVNTGFTKSDIQIVTDGGPSGNYLDAWSTNGSKGHLQADDIATATRTGLTVPKSESACEAVDGLSIFRFQWPQDTLTYKVLTFNSNTFSSLDGIATGITPHGWTPPGWTPGWVVW